LEGKKIHAKYGDKLRLLIPGIRAAGGKSDDQKRAVTAADATKAGASYIVLGRMVTEAPDPKVAITAAMRSI
jgi:orotidine-5'-phosphate decarboxylase